MIFFFDHCIPPRIGKALRELGKEIEILHEKYSPSTPDIEWMRVVEQHNWIVLTEDAHIRRRELERATLQGSTLRMVFLPEPFAREKLWTKVVLLITWWPEIENACATLEPGGRLIMKTKKGKLSIAPLARL